MVRAAPDTRADLAQEAQCLCLSLRRTARAVTRLYDDALAPSGLRATQFSLLSALRARGPLTMSTLAELLVMDRTTLSRNLRPLEKRGLISITPGADRRERWISITAAGTRVARKAQRLWRDAQACMVGTLGAPAAHALLEQLSETVAAARKD